MNKKRLVHVDIIKMIAIVFVIIGHATHEMDTALSLRNYTYAFHMPLFFFAYGMSRNRKPSYNITSYKTLITSRFYGLLVPYLLWGLIFTSFSAKNMGLLIYGTRHSIMEAGTLSSLWFLPTMFISCIFYEVMCHIISRFPKLNRGIVLITMGLSLLLCRLLPTATGLMDTTILGIPFGFNIAFMGLIFMILGNYIEGLVKKFSQMSFQYKNIYLILVTIVGYALVCLQVYNPAENGFVLMAQGDYGNYIIFFVCAMSGCIATTALALLLEKSRCCGILAAIGANTLVIFITHKEMIATVNSVTSLVIKNSILNLMSVIVIILILSSLLSFGIAHILPVLAGKRKTNM